MKQVKTTIELADTFGRVEPIEGRPGWYCLSAPWREVSGFFRKLGRLDREFVGLWHCDGSNDDKSWAIIYPWQK